jgi:hypothetical protein
LQPLRENTKHNDIPYLQNIPAIAQDLCKEHARNSAKTAGLIMGFSPTTEENGTGD